MLRLAARSDASAIARVQVESWHAAYRGLMPDARLEAFTIAVREPAWRRNLANHGGPRTTVFERDGHVIGFASIGACRDQERTGEIWALYVAPGAWGSGVGSSLMAEALQFLDGEGYPTVMLWVLEGNTRAIGFYQGSGFRLDGKRSVDDGLPQLRMTRASK